MAKAGPDSIPLTIRIYKKLRDQLEVASKSHGISMNAEIMNRLRRTVEDDTRVSNVLETRTAVGIAKLLASIVGEIGKIGGFQQNYSIKDALDWYNNPYAYDLSVRAVNRALELMRPEGEVAQPKYFGIPNEDLARIEKRMIDQLIFHVVNGDLRWGEEGDRLEDTRTDLGDLYPRLRENIDKAIGQQGQE